MSHSSARSLAKAIDDAEALEKAENDVKAADVVASRARETGRGPVGPPHAGARRPRERPLRFEQGPNRISDRWPSFTRRNIQEGEYSPLIGTMNNAGTVLLTLADMSIIQAE
jgi:hypothetical protein